MTHTDHFPGVGNMVAAMRERKRKGWWIGMTENEKDWRNPAFMNVYLALATALFFDDNIMDWLNRNGFCNLTCCPECHVDDFTHVEGCSTGDKIDKSLHELERLAKAGVFNT